MDKGLLKRALLRFVRVGVGGAVSAMLVLSAMMPDTWNDLKMWLTKLMLAGIFGFVNGVLNGVDKYRRDLIEEKKEDAEIDKPTQSFLDKIDKPAER